MSLESAGHMSAHGRGDLLSFILLYTTLYAGFGVVSPFLPTLLESRGLQPDQIGLVLALSTGVRLVSGPLAGRIADLYSALRAVFACSAVAAALTAFGYLPAHAFRSLLAVSVIYAAMLAPLTTIADALALAAARPRGEAKGRFEYGWVRGAGSAAFILGSVLAGQAIVAIDLDVIIWGGSALLVAAAAAAIGVSTLLAIIAFVVGLVTVVDNPTRQVFVNELVGPRNLRNAISINSSVFQLGGLIGPAIAGIPIASAGFGRVFLISAASFAVYSVR